MPMHLLQNNNNLGATTTTTSQDSKTIEVDADSLV